MRLLAGWRFDCPPILASLFVRPDFSFSLLFLPSIPSHSSFLPFLSFPSLQGDYASATALYDNLLLQNPANVVALKRLYVIEKAQNNISEAIQALVKYLNENMVDASGWYELADLYISQGHWEAAAASLEEVVLIDPLDAHVHTLLGECYYGMASNTQSGIQKAFSNDSLVLLSRRHFSEALNLKRGDVRAAMGLRMASRESVLRPASLPGGVEGQRVREVALVDGAVDQSEVGMRLHELACDELDKALSSGEKGFREAAKRVGTREMEDMLQAGQSS